MTVRHFLCVGLAFHIAAANSTTVRAADPPRMLMLTQSAGFTHKPVKRDGQPLAGAEIAMIQLAQQSGEFTVDCTQDAASDITKENLQKYDIVTFYTTGNLPIADADLEYFLGDWLKQKGHGFMGFHSSTDTYKNHEPYWDMIGGTFNGHPWGQNTLVNITVHDPDHPGMKPFGSEFEYRDEIYQYRNWQPEKVRVLMSLDMGKTQTKRPYLVPVAWCKQVGEGKLFYNNLGHREDTWTNETFLKSVVGAVRWIAGKEEGVATPNPEVSMKQHQHSIAESAKAGLTVEALEAQQKAAEEKKKAREAQKVKAETADK